MWLSWCRATWSRPFRKGGAWCESGRAWRVMLSCIRKPRLKGNARMMGRWRRAGAMRSRWSRVCGLVGGTGWGQGGWDKSQVAPSEIATFSTRCAIHSSCERPLCNILLTSRSARALACCHAQKRPGGAFSQASRRSIARKARALLLVPTSFEQSIHAWRSKAIRQHKHLACGHCEET